jgi:hypothetical protein
MREEARKRKEIEEMAARLEEERRRFEVSFASHAVCSSHFH